MESNPRREIQVVRVRGCSGLIIELLLSTGEIVYSNAGQHLSQEDATKLISNPDSLQYVSLKEDTITWPMDIRIKCRDLLSTLPTTDMEAASTALSSENLENLAKYLALTNLNYFLPHFTFPFTKFKLDQGQTHELADHLVLVKGRGILFQLKERASDSTGSLESWFKNKVLRKAKRQIAKSRQLLATCTRIPVTNLRGHSATVESKEIQELHGVICYSAASKVVDASVASRWIFSKSAGFISVLSIQEYEAVLSALVTLSELLEYFTFRQRVIERWHHEGQIPSEPALLGQFMRGDDNARPNENYSSFLEGYNVQRGDFDLSFLLQDLERSSPAYDPAQQEYTDILAEFALLNRTELLEARKRILRCVEYSSNTETLFECHRMATPGCAFLFSGFGSQERENIDIAFMNLTLACKYDLKAARQISLGIWKEGAALNFRWCLIEGDWYYDELMAQMLLEANPFRDVRQQILTRYHLS